MSSTRSPALEERGALVRWPQERDRRNDLAARGVPRLLVIEPGTPVPPLGRSEDWISRSSDERDVAVRLERLSAGAWPVLATMPIELPAGLSAVECRVATRMAAAVGRFVPIGDVVGAGLADEDVDGIVRSLAAVFEAEGLRLTVVGDAGYLLERSEPTPP